MIPDLGRTPAVSWTPILSGDRRARARDAIRDILDALPESASSVDDPSIGGGAAGIALLHAYASLASDLGFDPADLRDRALGHLQRAIDTLARRRAHPSLFAGFAGVAWAVEHIGGLLGVTSGDEVDEIDDALLGHLDRVPWRADYDLILGLVGMGVYAAERMGRPAGPVLLERVVARLEETASSRPPGTSWLTRAGLLPPWQRVLFPNGYYNLGVAHGVPGVVALLAQAHAAGVAPGATEPLLEGAMRWLWAQAREKAPGPRFPTMVDERARDEEQSRLAWCYGDLGVATSLLGAARQVRRADWERQALELLARCAERSFASSGVNDAGLCHGATGNAQMFNRVFQATGDASFREAAEKWIDHALAYRKPGTGVGGFQAWIVNTTLEEAAWQDVPGFLEGAAGIALALLAATQPVEPRWDRLLLIAVDPAHRPAPVGA